MGILLLVRHGQASLGAADYDQLSGLGYRQARAAGARLARADLVIDRVVCGTLARQRDSAAAVMAELPPPPGNGPAGSWPHVDDRLDEYDHGALLATGTAAVSFETVTSAEANRELQPALEAAIARWAAGDAGAGESHDAFTGRVEAVMADLTREPGCTVAVTSGGVIAVACTQALGLEAGRWPALARVIVNGSITKFISGRTGTNLLTFNDHAHLEDDRSLISYR